VAVTALAAILVAVLILAVDVRTLVTILAASQAVVAKATAATLILAADVRRLAMILAASQAVDANPRAVVC
jgi:hypothetical protein